MSQYLHALSRTEYCSNDQSCLGLIRYDTHCVQGKQTKLCVTASMCLFRFLSMAEGDEDTGDVSDDDDSIDVDNDDENGQLVTRVSLLK